MATDIFHNKHYPKRGEIYYIKKGNTTPTGSEMWPDRHALIVSANHTNKNSNVVQVVYITTRSKSKNPLHIDVSNKNVHRIVLCEQITPVDKNRIVEYKGRLSDKQMKQVDKALAWNLNLFRYMREKRIDNGYQNML